MTWENIRTALKEPTQNESYNKGSFPTPYYCWPKCMMEEVWGGVEILIEGLIAWANNRKEFGAQFGLVGCVNEEWFHACHPTWWPGDDCELSGTLWLMAWWCAKISDPNFLRWLLVLVLVVVGDDESSKSLPSPNSLAPLSWSSVCWIQHSYEWCNAITHFTCISFLIRGRRSLQSKRNQHLNSLEAW